MNLIEMCELADEFWSEMEEVSDWVRPSRKDCLRWAFCEAGEAVDAYLTSKGIYKRNNPEDHHSDVVGELGDLALMLLGGMMEFSLRAGCEFFGSNCAIEPLYPRSHDKGEWLDEITYDVSMALREKVERRSALWCLVALQRIKGVFQIESIVKNTMVKLYYAHARDISNPPQFFLNLNIGA